VPSEPQLFDAHSESYRDDVESSIRFARGSLDHFTRLKADHLIRICEAHCGNPGDLSALDVGCGTGETDRYLVERVGELFGADVAAKPLDVARVRNPNANYVLYDGVSLPFHDSAVDVAFAICVVHHVPQGRWNAFLTEMSRVTKPGGLVVIFEHNPLNPLTRHAVSNCEFDEDAVLLRRRELANLMRTEGLEIVEESFIAFTPWGSPRVRQLERWVRHLPFGAQHVVAGRVPVIGGQL